MAKSTATMMMPTTVLIMQVATLFRISNPTTKAANAKT